MRKIEGEDRPVKYKFHRNFKIQANDYFTIWSCDSGEVAKPPHTVVMKVGLPEPPTKRRIFRRSKPIFMKFGTSCPESF